MGGHILNSKRKQINDDIQCIKPHTTSKYKAIKFQREAPHANGECMGEQSVQNDIHLSLEDTENDFH
jgi:hypothetical protein